MSTPERSRAYDLDVTSRAEAGPSGPSPGSATEINHGHNDLFHIQLSQWEKCQKMVKETNKQLDID